MKVKGEGVKVDLQSGQVGKLRRPPGISLHGGVPSTYPRGQIRGAARAVEKVGYR